DHRVVGIRAVGDSLNQQAHRIIVIGLLNFRGVHTAKRGREAAGVIVAESDHFQRRQVAVGDELVELAFPFVVAPQIRVVLIVAAEVWIIEPYLRDRLLGGRDLNNAGGMWIFDGVGNGTDAADIVDQKAVIANRSARVQHSGVDKALLIAAWAIGGG